MAVKPYSPDDQEDPYAKSGVGSDSTATDPNTPAPQADAPTPKPYTPPPTVAAPKTPSATDQGGDAPPVRTFAQMEAEGQARPPQPDASQVAPAPMANTLDAAMAMPPGNGELTQGATPGGAVVPGTNLPAGTMGSGDQPSGTMGYGGGGQPSGTMGSGAQSGGDAPLPIPTNTGEVTQGTTPGGATVPGTNLPLPGGGTAPPTALPSSVDSILPLLTGKATGNDTSPLQDATTQATLDQLKNPNPFNSDEVKREYDYLGGNIDDQYSQDQRALDSSMAQRGLYGSAGKDFHSGRLADLNVGKRTAKESLANSLATAQAQSQGQYQANAINQGQAGANASNANQLDWLHSLMGYGNDAFNHDLQTAQFQEGQNNDEQDYLLQLLKAGYGA